MPWIVSAQGGRAGWHLACGPRVLLDQEVTRPRRGTGPDPWRRAGRRPWTRRQRDSPIVLDVLPDELLELLCKAACFSSARCPGTSMAPMILPARPCGRRVVTVGAGVLVAQAAAVLVDMVEMSCRLIRASLAWSPVMHSAARFRTVSSGRCPDRAVVDKSSRALVAGKNSEGGVGWAGAWGSTLWWIWPGRSSRAGTLRRRQLDLDFDLEDLGVHALGRVLGGDALPAEHAADLDHLAREGLPGVGVGQYLRRRTRW